MGLKFVWGDGQTVLEHLVEQLEQHIVLGAPDATAAAADLAVLGEWVRRQQADLANDVRLCPPAAAAGVVPGRAEVWAEPAGDMSPVETWRGECSRCRWRTENRLTRAEAEADLCWHSRSCRGCAERGAAWITLDPDTGRFELHDSAARAAASIVRWPGVLVWVADPVHEAIVPCAVEADAGVVRLIGMAGRHLASVANEGGARG